MAALGRIPPEQGIATMQSINITVLNPAFLTAFLGTGVVCVALAAGSYVWWGEASGKLLLAASLIYLVGCIGVTMVCNVPLNDGLAAVRPNTPEAAAAWSNYLTLWTNWNHLRTVAPRCSPQSCSWRLWSSGCCRQLRHVCGEGWEAVIRSEISIKYQY
jgi:uncharacterized membrane protein